MDKDRWAKFAMEAQPHIEAILRAVKREKLDIAAISLYGAQDKAHGLESSMIYIEGKDHYGSDRFLGGGLKIAINGDEYKAYIKT